MNTIETRTLGRTGLQVSILGLGAGGNSRLGLSTGKTLEHATEVVRAALDLGVTLFDTARAYGTERAVGEGIKGRLREQLVISSKSSCVDGQGQLLSPQAFADNLDTSLLETGLETIDVYYIHGLRLEHYNAAYEQIVPVLERARQAGKLRFIGVTEAFESDTRHAMLQRAVQDDVWDVMMVGFNLLNPTARERVLAITQPKGIGTMGMFAVRRGLVDEHYLRILLGRLAEAGLLPAELGQDPDLFKTLGLAGVAGYRC